MRYALWIVQGLLALLFLFAGAMKFIMPIEEMTRLMPMPGAFLRFIGVTEILGGLGLVLPSLLRIRPGLTPLAAVCLMVVMVGAVVISLMTGGAAAAVMPFVVLILLGFVAYGRWKLVPIGGSSGSTALQGAR
jgi:hypothetical protein